MVYKNTDDVFRMCVNGRRLMDNEGPWLRETEIVVLGDDSLMNIDQYQIQRVAPESAKTDEILGANVPSTDAKKKSAEHTDARKTTANAPRHKRRTKKQPPKPKSIWQKIVG